MFNRKRTLKISGGRETTIIISIDRNVITVKVFPIITFVKDFVRHYSILILRIVIFT